MSSARVTAGQAAHLGGRANAPADARKKMKTIAELAELAALMRSDGQVVVMAHGVFDLLHMGHVRHLEEARGHGTRLIVTVTPDRYVNKGPGRPVYHEAMRAEMLAALACVDWVAVNDTPTAEAALEQIRPHIYAKGPDYADQGQDVTGKIQAEQRVVERHGGRLVLTDDVTLSSTELINRHLNPFAPAVRAFLDAMRGNGECQEILGLLETVSRMRVLVVGETIVDEYRYVLPMSKTPKENLIATLHQSRELFAGGVIATANHVASICGEVDVLTVVGAEDDHGELIQAAAKPNVRLHRVPRDKGPTPLKCRYIDSGNMRKLFEVYYMDDSPISEARQATLNDRIVEMAGAYDVVIANDFGHGMIQRSTVNALVEHARFLAVNTQTNSANFGYNLISKYPRADYVCIDGPEARLAVGDKFSPIEEVVAQKVAGLVESSCIVVTQGQYGCTAYAKDEPPCQVPAFADKAVDTVGAGDAFLAITAPLVAAGGALRHVAFVGNVAGGLKVNIVGHRQSIDKASLVKAVTALLK
jgi:rfaE bifunctional protein nucleotidyltransferase chain/domain